jgi:predicted Zn finger-like uncharacterized protein
MLTQCPSCQTTFRVTSEILRVAYGQVRCGRCQTQFDATERLIEETDDGVTESGRYMRQPRQMQPPPPPLGQIDVDEPIEHEDITLEGRHIEISGTYSGIDETGSGEPQFREEIVEEWVEIDEDEATQDVDVEAVADDLQAYADANYEEQDDEDPRRPTADVTYEDDDDLRRGAARVNYEDEDEDLLRAARELEAENQARAALSRQRAAAAAAPARNFTSTRSSTGPRRASAQLETAEEENDLDFSPPRAQRQPAARIWNILAPPLMLLLLVQVVHNYRATLARHPTIGAPLQSIYSALGMTLRPDWNLHAYEVQQWGVVSDPATPGTLKVRASVKNLADFAQPYPLLKLVLEDRWGEQVRAREFEPSEYLDPTVASDRLLDPAQQAGATIAIVDPGPDAEGFRFDVCLRGARGPVCATDVPGTK